MESEIVKGMDEMKDSLQETVDQLKTIILSVVESEDFPLRCLYEKEDIDRISSSAKFTIWENPFSPQQLAVETDLLDYLLEKSEFPREDLRMIFEALLGNNALFSEERWQVV